MRRYKRRTKTTSKVAYQARSRLGVVSRQCNKGSSPLDMRSAGTGQLFLESGPSTTSSAMRADRDFEWLVEGSVGFVVWLLCRGVSARLCELRVPATGCAFLVSVRTETGAAYRFVIADVAGAASRFVRFGIGQTGQDGSVCDRHDRCRHRNQVHAKHPFDHLQARSSPFQAVLQLLRIVARPGAAGGGAGQVWQRPQTAGSDGSCNYGGWRSEAP